jgi:hypothetical protein
MKYTVENFITLNPNKCDLMRISLKNINALTYYYLNNDKIAKVSSHKHLGVIYDDKLSFNKHCDSIVSKAIQKFGFLETRNKINGEIFLMLYKSYILPILEFSN